MNNIVEDFLLLAVGGVAGLAAGAALCSDDDDEEEEAVEETSETDSVERLILPIRAAARSAIASCKTEEERNAVAEEIHQSVTQLQEKLAERQAALTGGGDGQDFRALIAKLNDALDETMTEAKKPIVTGGAPA